MAIKQSGYEAPEQFLLRVGPKIAAIVGGAILGLILLFGSWYTVESGCMGVVTRFGAVSRVEGPGLHGKLPLVEGVTEIGTRTRTLEWAVVQNGDGRMESYSKDQQPAHIGVKVVYSVKGDPKSVENLFSQFKTEEGFANAIIIPRALEAVKTVFGTYDAVRVIQHRADFNAEVDAAFRARIGDGPVIIEAIQIQDISFSDVYEKAVEARMQAQVEVEKVGQNLERERKEAEIKVVQAEAAAKAVRLAGEAEAASIRARSEALRESPKLVELVLAEKWNGVLPTTMVPGASVPFVNVR